MGGPTQQAQLSAADRARPEAARAGDELRGPDEPQLSLGEWARPEVLSAFLDELRRLGFRLGTSHYAAAQDLLLAVVAEPRVPPTPGPPPARRFGGDGSPARLARLLGPVVCSTPREQEAFPWLVARWGAGPGRELADALAENEAAVDGGRAATALSKAAASGPGHAAPAPRLAGAIERIERAARLWLVPATILLLLFGLGALYFWYHDQTLHPLQIVPLEQDRPVPIQAPPASGGRLGWLLAAAAAGALAAAGIGWRLWIDRLGRQYLVRRPAADPPELERLGVRAASDELFAPVPLRRASEQLRRRVTVPGREVDVEATIERTVRLGGWPAPVAARQNVRPEYLLLIERASPGDQRARFSDELSEQLAKQGVLLVRAYFDHDPRTCFRVVGSRLGAPPSASAGELSTTAAAAGRGAISTALSGIGLTDGTARRADAGRVPSAAGLPGLPPASAELRPLGLRELYSLYPDHRLLLVSECEGLFSPVTGEEAPWVDQLLAWKQRAVLSPRPVAEWGRREHQLARRFAVAPAALSGWATVAALFEGRPVAPAEAGTSSAALGTSALAAEATERRPIPGELRQRPWRWLERNPPEPWRLEEMLDGLERWLGEAGFYWLSACAVYPEMYLELTVSLGKVLMTDGGERLCEAGRLASLLELPWLRHGSMPDWLRRALLERLPRRREARVRAVLAALLLTALDDDDPQAREALVLELAGPRRRTLDSLWRPVWRRLSRRPAKHGPMRDYVFRDFMAGRSRRLAVAFPQQVARLLGWKRRGVAWPELVESTPMRRARWVMGWLLVMAPLGVLCLERSFLIALGSAYLRRLGAIVVGGIPGSLVALAYIWRKPRLIIAGAGWETAACLSILYVDYGLVVGNELAIRAGVILALGLLAGNRVGPFGSMPPPVRLKRIRRVLVLVAATYLIAGFDLLTAVPPSYGPAIYALMGSLALTLVALAYTERVPWLALTSVPSAAVFLYRGWGSNWWLAAVLLAGTLASLLAWRLLRSASVDASDAVVARRPLPRSVPKGGASRIVSRPRPPHDRARTSVMTETALPQTPDGSVRAARWALGVLTLINLFNYLDRYVPAALVENLRRSELHVTDTESGLLMSGFIVVYMLTSPLFGLLGDRGRRPRIVAAGIALWSLATGLAGLARSFAGLLVARSVVGVGEAAYVTISPAMLADSFPRGERGRVFAIFNAATPIGAAAGYILGGLVATHFGWRAAFFVAGFPGLLLAVLMWRLHDPPRGASDTLEAGGAGTAGEAGTAGGADDGGGGGQRHPAGLAAVYAELLRNRPFVLIVLGYAAYTFALGALAYWMPAFLERVRGVPASEATVQFGIIVVATGFAGTFAGGWLGDMLLRRWSEAYLWVSGIATLAAAPVALLAFLAASRPVYTAAIVGAEVLLFFSTGPINSALVNVVAPAHRATAMALNILVIHLLGDVPSPPLIGRLSDATSLARAFLVLPVMMALAGTIWIYAAWRGQRSGRRTA